MLDTVTKQNPDTEHLLMMLDNGIEGSRLSMHTRDYYNALHACRAAFNEDTVSSQRRAEFEALSQDVKNEMAAKGDFGVYGVFHMYSALSHPEVPVALTLRKLEIIREEQGASGVSKVFNGLSKRDRAQLENREVLAQVSTRFPSMTAERIAQALRI